MQTGHCEPLPRFIHAHKDRFSGLNHLHKKSPLFRGALLSPRAPDTLLIHKRRSTCHLKHSLAVS